MSCRGKAPAVEDQDLVTSLKDILLPPPPSFSRIHSPAMAAHLPSPSDSSNSNPTPSAEPAAVDWSQWERFVENAFDEESTQNAEQREVQRGREGEREGEREGGRRDVRLTATEYEVLGNLLDAFPGIDLEDMASAYVISGKDPNFTAEILSGRALDPLMSSSPSKTLNAAVAGHARMPHPMDGAATHHVGRERSCEDILDDDDDDDDDWLLSRASSSPHTKVQNVTNREVGRGVGGERREGGEVREAREDAQERAAVSFLYSMFGEELGLGMGIIQDVYDGCGGEVNKSSELLLKLTEGCEQPLSMSTLSMSQVSRSVTEEADAALLCLLGAFPEEEPEFIIATFQKCNEDAGSAAAALLAASSEEAEEESDPLWKANFEVLEKAFPLVSSDILKSVLRAANNSVRGASDMLKESGVHPVSGHHMMSAWSDVPIPPTSTSVSITRDLDFPPPKMEKDRKVNEERRDKTSERRDDLYSTERKDAENFAKMRHFYFTEAAKAYRKGNKAVAASLSSEGHRYSNLLKAANKAASERLLKITNSENRTNLKLDLHYLHVEDAISEVESHVESLRRLSSTVESLEIVTGKGLHSSGRSAKIKPAVEEYLSRADVEWSRHPSNPGVLVVYFGASGNRAACP